MGNANDKIRRGENTRWDGLKHGERQQIVTKSGTSFFVAKKVLTCANPEDASTGSDNINKVIAAYNEVINARQKVTETIKEVA